MEKKYKFTDETRQYKGRLLHRIVALRDFSNIQAGEKAAGLRKKITFHMKAIAGLAIMR